MNSGHPVTPQNYIDPKADEELKRLSDHFEWARGFALVKVSVQLLEELGNGSGLVTFTARKEADGTYELVVTKE